MVAGEECTKRRHNPIPHDLLLAKKLVRARSAACVGQIVALCSSLPAVPENHVGSQAADLEPTTFCRLQEAADKCMLGWFAGAGRRRLQAASWQQRVLTTVKEDFRPFIQYACGVYCIHQFVGSATIVTGAQHGAAMSSFHLFCCRCHAITVAACRCQHAAHLQCQGRLGAQRAPVSVLSENKNGWASCPDVACCLVLCL